MAASPAPDSVLLRAALAYAERLGWAVLPLHSVDARGRCTCGRPACDSPGKHPRTPNGVKDASAEPAQIRRWWQRWPAANVGVATGGDLCVIDVDLHDADGYQSLKRLQGDLEVLPETPVCSTGSGGQHWYFALDGATVRNSSNQLAPGLDVRGEGGYVVAPPSVHETGAHYAWRTSPLDVPLAPLPPAWRAELAEKPPGARSGLQTRPEQRTGTDAPLSAPGRNVTLTSLAGALRRRGAEHDAILAALQERNRLFPEPLDDREVEKIARSVSRYAPAPEFAHVPLQEQQAFALTDVGNAERLVATHGDDLRYCEPLGGWLVWSGTHWQRDLSGEVTRRAIATVRALYLEAAGEENPDRREALAKWALKSEAAPRIEALLRLARDLAGVAVAPELFDRQTWLVVCSNGTLDLRSGQLRESRRADLSTRALPVAYDPDAACPTWRGFLARVLPKPELVSFVQRAIGYSLSGDTRERVFFLLHGQGRNGKSTLLETLARLLGSYARTAEASTFLERNQDRVSNDLAMLAGARLVAVSEGTSGQRLHESLIKRVTGRDAVTARYLFREYFTFEPQFKLWLATNHRPEVRDAGEAMWDRIRLIPFEVRIPEAEQDKQLPEKLRQELPGILAWAVAGCRDWLQHGLGEPAEVRAATDAYRDEMDAIGPFLAAQCVLDPQAYVSAGALYRGYSAWCEAERERPLNPKHFGLRLADHGFRVHRGTGGARSWIGLRLRLEDEPVTGESDASDVKTPLSDSFPIYTPTREESETHDLTSLASLAGVNEAAESPPACWVVACKQPVVVDSYSFGTWCMVHRDRGDALERAGRFGYPAGLDVAAGREGWQQFMRTASRPMIATALAALT